MRRKIVLAVIAALMIVVLACISFGDSGLSEAEKLQTAVAQTVAAQISQPKDTLQPLPTITLAPLATQAGPPTQTPLPCNKAEFISETIPDDTEYNPGDIFTKTWRLKNIGTCTWNTNYKLTYASGDKMGGAATKNLTQAVAPGEQVDISIALTAPAAEGTYKGFWKIADDTGAFYVNTLWVQIKVKAAPLNSYSVSLDAVPAQGGSVWQNGDVYPGDYVAGDAVGDFGVQAFAAFDISSIPATAQITEVIVDFGNFIVLGDPFGDLGCLRIYAQSYQPLNAGDYTPPPVIDALVRWCSSGELGAVTVEEEVKTYLQSKLGSQYLPFRLQFKEHQTDGSNDNDAVGFFNMTIDVNYKAP